VNARHLAALLLLALTFPPAQQAPPADRDGTALAALHERLFARPFYAVARVTRLDAEASPADSMVLRMHYRGPGHVLVQLEGAPPKEARVALLFEGRLHLYFPDADLVMDLPTGMGSERLFGLDITMQDLLALGGDPELFHVRDEGPETVAGRDARRLVLTPRRPQDSFDDEITLWLSDPEGTPVRMRAVAAGGRSVRTIDFETGDDRIARALALPSRWTCRTEGRRPSASRAEFLLFEPTEGMNPRRFTPAALRRWR